MATVIAPLIEPDGQAIQAHLEALFAPARVDYPDGLIEIRHGVDGALNKHAYFGLSEARIADAVHYAVEMNRMGQNVYVGVNPRKGTTNTKHAAKDSDVEIAFFQFADLDKKEAIDRLAGDYPLKATMVVVTGTVPNSRPHLYWQLEEPVGNMPAWTERQRGIAHVLGGDAVINPSRIMRLAGTVNFPSQDKVGRGYKVELTTLLTEFADERPPVSPEQIAFAYPPRSEPVANYDAQPVAGQNTLQAMRSTRMGDLLAACRNGDQWHNNMVRLVAHMAAKGRTDAEILGLADNITLAGYNVEQTRREMTAALRSARSKWDLPEPQDAVEEEEQAREDADAVFDLLTLDALENMPPPTWLVHEMIADHGLSVIYGDPGAGKSFIALDMCLRLSMGMDWHGVATKPCGVLYIAGEGARGLGKRVKGWRREHALEGVDAPFALLPVAVQLLDEKDRAKLIRTIDAAKASAGFEVGIVVIDTVSRALAGADENGQEAMSAFVSACGQIQQHIGGAVLAVHHSGKDKDKGMRGSTVLLGGCDASIRVTKDEQIVTIKTEKQKDAEQAEPIYMTMKKVEWGTGLEEPQSTLVPERRKAPVAAEETLNKEQIERIFGLVDAAWESGNPLSHSPQTRTAGRYAPSVLAKALQSSEHLVSGFLTSWLENGQMMVDAVNSHSKLKGIKVVRRLNYGE